MPSDSQPVTEEMVEAARTIVSLAQDHVPYYLIREILEAAQAVAPPKALSPALQRAVDRLTKLLLSTADGPVTLDHTDGRDLTLVLGHVVTFSSSVAPPKDSPIVIRQVLETMETCGACESGAYPIDPRDAFADALANLRHIRDLLKASSPVAPATPSTIERQAVLDEAALICEAVRDEVQPSSPRCSKCKRHPVESWQGAAERCAYRIRNPKGAAPATEKPTFINGNKDGGLLPMISNPSSPSGASGTEEDGLPEVGGESMTRSLNAFVQSCRVLLRDEQEKIAPDSALIATLCDAVRLSREHARAMTAPLASALAGEEPSDAR